MLFTVHKLIALAAVVAFGLIVYRLHQAGDLRAIVPLTALVVTGILFLGLFLSGAWLSRGALPAPTLVRIHQIAPWLALASSAATLLRLASGRS